MAFITKEVTTQQIYAWMLSYLKENNGANIQEVAGEALIEFSLDEEDETISEIVYDIAVEAKENMYL